MTFKEGQYVRIPCDAQLGGLPGEYLVTIAIGEKHPLSGFVKEQYVSAGSHKDEYYIEAIVVAVEEGRIRVRIPGSFFTVASGTASVSTDWATEHIAELQP